MNPYNDKVFLSRVKEIVKEIEKHKWFESEKAGHDIGGNRAALDWLKRHYGNGRRTRDIRQPDRRGIATVE